jgi:hypothetical protein
MKFLEDFNIKKYVKPKKKTSKPQGSSSITYTKPLPKGPIPVKKVVPDKIPTKPLPTTSSNKSSIVTKPFFNIPIQSPLPSPTAIKARHNEFVKANARANRAISDFKSNNVIANATSGIFKGVEFNKRVAPFIDTRPQAVRDFKVKNYAFRKNPIFKWYEKKVPNVGERRSGTGAFSNNGYVRNFTTGLFKVLSSDADPRGMLSDPTRRKIHEMQRANQAKALRAFTKGTGDLIADTIIRPFYQNAWQQAELKDRLKLRERKMNELYGLNRKQQTYYVEDDKGRVYAIKGSKNGGDTYSYIDSNGKALSLDITALPKGRVNIYKSIGLIPRDKVFRVKDGDQFLSQLLDPNYNSGLLARDSKGLPYISNKGLKQYLENNGVRSNSMSLFEALSPKRRADDLMMQRYLVKSADDYVQNKYFGGYPQMSTRSIGANLAINFLGLGLNIINRPQQGVSAYIIGNKEGKTASQIRKDMYAGFVEGKDTSFTEYYLTKKDKHPYLKGLLFDSISDPLLFTDFIAKGGAGVAKGITKASVKSEITERSLREVTNKYLGGARLLNKNEGLTFKESLHTVFETHKLGTVHQTRGVYSRTLGRLKGVQMTADALDNTLPKALLPNRTKRQLINTMVTNPKQVNKNWIANVLHEAGFRNNLKEDLADAIYDSYRTSRLVTNTARANKIADSTSGAYKVYKKFKAFGEEVDRVDTALTKAAFPVFTGTVKGTKKVVRAIKASELKSFVEKAKALKQMPLSDVFKSDELLDLTKRRAVKQVDKAVEPLVKNHMLSMELINEGAEKYEAAVRYGQHGKTDNLADLIAARDSQLIDTLDNIQTAVSSKENGYGTAMRIIKDTYDDAADVTSVHEFLDNALQSNNNFREGLVYVTDDSERKTLSALLNARENQIYKTQRVLDNTEATKRLKDLAQFTNIAKQQVRSVENYTALEKYLVESIEQAHNATHYVDTHLQELVTKRIDEVKELLRSDATTREFNHTINQIIGDVKSTASQLKTLKKESKAVSISSFFSKFNKVKEELGAKSVKSTFYKDNTIEQVLKDKATANAFTTLTDISDEYISVVSGLKQYLPEYLHSALDDVMNVNVDDLALQTARRKVLRRGEDIEKAVSSDIKYIGLSDFPNGITDLMQTLETQDFKKLSTLLNLDVNSNMVTFVQHLDSYIEESVSEAIDTLRLIDSKTGAPLANYLADVESTLIKTRNAAKYEDITLDQFTTVRAIKANAAQLEATAQDIYKQNKHLFKTGDYYLERVDRLIKSEMLDNIIESYRLADDYKTATTVEQLATFADDIAKKKKANALLSSSLEEAESALSPELYNIYRDALFDARDLGHSAMEHPEFLAPDFVDHVIEQHYYQYAKANYNIDKTIGDLYSFSKSDLSKKYDIDKEILDRLSIGHTAGIDTYRSILTNIVHDPESFGDLIERAKAGRDVFIFDTETLGLNTKRNTNHVFSMGLYKLDPERCSLLKYDKELERYTSESINEFMRALLKDADSGNGYKEILNKIPNYLIDNGWHPDTSFMDIATFKKMYGHEGYRIENDVFANNIVNTMQEMQGTPTLDLHNVVLCGFNNHGFDNVVLANNCPEIAALFRDVPQNIDMLVNIKAKHGLIISDKDKNIIGNLYNSLLSALHDTDIEKFKYAYPSRLIDSYDRFYSTLQRLGHSATSLDVAVAHGTDGTQYASALDTLFKNTPESIDLNLVASELREQKFLLKSINHLKDDSLIVDHIFNLIPSNERAWETGYLVMKLDNPKLTRAEYEALYKSGELAKYETTISNWFHILDSSPEIDVLKLTPEEFIVKADELRAAADVMTGGQTSNIIRWINGIADGGYSYFQTLAVQNKVNKNMLDWFGHVMNNYHAIETYRQLTANIQNNLRHNADDIFDIDNRMLLTGIAWRELKDYCLARPELANALYIFNIDFDARTVSEKFAILEELIMGKKYGMRETLFGTSDSAVRLLSSAYFDFSEDTVEVINYIFNTRKHNNYYLFDKEIEFFTRNAKGAAYEIASELERVKYDTDAFEEFAERLSGITGGASVEKHTMAVALQPINNLRKQIVRILNSTDAKNTITNLYYDLQQIKNVWDGVHHTRVKALVSDMLQNEDAILEHLITPDFNGMMFLRFSSDDDNIKLVDQLLTGTHPNSKYLQVRYLEKDEVVAVTLNELCDLDDKALHLLDTGKTIQRNNIIGRSMPTELLNTFKKQIDKLDTLAPDSVLKLYYESLQNLAAYSKHNFRDYTHGLLNVEKIDQLREVFDAANMMDLDKFGMQTIDGFVSAGAYLTLEPPKAVNGVKFYNNPLLTAETLLKRNAEQALDSHTTVAYFLRNEDLNSLNKFDLSDKEWFRVLDQLEDSFVVCAMGTDNKNKKYLSKIEAQIREAKKADDVKTLERLGEEYRAYNPVQLKSFEIKSSRDLQRAKEANAVLVPRVVYETLYGHVNNFTPTNPILRGYNRYVTMMKAFYISTLGTAMRNYIDETIKTYIDVGWEGVPIVHRARFQAMADLSDYNQIIDAIKKDLNTGQLIKGKLNSAEARAHQRLIQKGFADTPHYFNIPVSDAQKYYGYLAEAGILPKHLTERMDASNFLRMHAFMLEGASGGTQAGEIQARALAHSIPELEGVAARNKGVFGTLGAFLKMPDKDLDSYVSMGNYLFSKGVSAALTPMAYTEQITRLTHMYTLEELGIGKIEAFSRISKTHFNYDVKDRAAVYAQLLFPFFNFTKLNIDYWMNAWTKDAHSIHNLLRLNQQNLKEALDDNYERTRNGQWVDMSYLNHAMAGNPRIPNPAQNEGQTAWLKLNPSFYDAYNFLLDPMNQGMQDIFSPIQNVLQDRHFFDGAIKAGIFNQGYGGNGLRDFLPLIGSTILPMHENKLRYIDKTFTEYRNDTFAQLLKSPASFAQLPTILAFSKIDFGEDYEKFNKFLNANGYAYDFYTRQIKPIKDCVARDSKELSMYMYKKYGLVYDFITKTFVPAYLSKDPVTRNVSFKTPHSQAQWSDIQALAKLYQNKGYDFVSGSFVDLETKGAIFDRKQYEAWQRKRGYEKEYLTNTWVPLGTARAHSYGEAAEYMRTKGMEWDYILKKYVPAGKALAHNYKEANKLYAAYGFEYDYARNAYVPKGRATINNFNEYKRFQRERNGLEWDYATRQWVPIGTAKASSWKDLYGDDWHRRRHFHKHWKRRKGHKFKRFDTWEEVVEFQRGRGLAWDSITRKWVKLGTEATWDDLVEYKKSKGLGWDRINKQWVELDKVPTWDQYQKYKESQGLEWDYIQKTWVPKGAAIGKKWKDFQNYKKSTGKTYDYVQQRYVGGKKMRTPKAQFNYDYHMKYHVGKIKPKRNYLDSMIDKYINNQDPNVRYNITTMPSLNMYQVKSLRTKRPVPRMRLQEVQRMQTSFVKYYKKSQSI